MNDDFLRQYRQEPSEAFGNALYQRLADLDEPPAPITLPPQRKRSPRLLALVAALLIVIAVGVVTLESRNRPLTANLAQIDTRPPLSDLVPITAQNAAQISQIARVGRGRADAVAWSPDGTLIAVGVSNGVALYDADLKNAPRLLRTTHDSYLRPVSFSPDGKLIATGDGAAVRIWEVATGAQHALLDVNPEAYLDSIQFSPDGRWLAAGGALGTEEGMAIYTWDAQADKLVGKVEAQDTHSVQAIAFSPDGQMLAVQTDAGTSAYDPTLTKPKYIDYTPLDSGRGLAFSPDSKTLAIAHSNEFVLIDTTTLKYKQTVTIREDKTANLAGLVYSPDGSLIALADRSYGTLTWDTKKSIFVIPPTKVIYWRDLSNVAFSPDSQQIVTSSDGSNVVVTDAHTAAVIASRVDYDDSVAGLTINPDNVTVASYGYDGKLLLHNLQTGALMKEVPFSGTYITQIAFSPDGNLLAYSGFSSPAHPGGAIQPLGIQVVNWQTNAPSSTIDITDNPYFVFTSDGRIIAYDKNSEYLAWWDLSQPTMPHTLISDVIEEPQELRLSSNGNTLVEFKFGDDINIYNTATGKKTAIPASSGYNTSIALSPDGNLLAAIRLSSTNTSLLTTFDLRTGKQLMTVQFPTLSLGRATFSPDSKLLAVIGAGLFDIFTPDNPTPIYSGADRDSSGTNVTFSNNGHFIVTGDLDGVIRVWGVSSDATAQP
ncbi:MAG TPA: WD40 repeat domain-containing protein [Phototrophicaceae bacterium]|nr:WD40 repeat domain-containing protein [Phototrophicaceae bacterium]